MGVSRIKGITVEIGGDTTKLQTALKGVNTEIKNTQSQLKDVEKLLKLDPGNTELLSQKYRTLQQEIQATKEKLNTLKEASKQADQALKDGTISQEQYDALQREIAETEQSLKSLEQEYKNFGSVQAQQVAAAGEKMKEFGGKVEDAGKTLTTHVTLPLAAVGAAGAASFAEVDKTMQLTNKTMGNTAEEAELLNKAMKEAAANSTFGMKDAATATLNFARAGLDAEQAAAALAPAMNLAAGEGGNLDTVSGGLVATINGFHGSFEDAGHYADVFAAACNNSALDVDSLSGAMSVAAPIFSAAGYSVNDAALYMGVMANNGIEADKAANSLKTGLARLVSPAKEGYEAMKQLGIEVTNADGSMKDSVTIQRELHEAFGKLSESEQIAAASAIFGKNQMAPWLALINTAPEDVGKLNESLETCAGTTDEMAEAMMSGFGGSLEKLKSSIDVLVTSIGEALAPTIQKVAEFVQGLVDKFNALTPAQQETIVKIGLIVAAVGPLLVIVGKVITAVGTIMTIVPKISGAITAVKGAFAALNAVMLANPIVLIIAAIAALVAAFIYLWNNCEGFRQFWIDLWENVKEIAVTVWEAIKTFFTQAWEAIKTTFETVWGGIRDFFSGIWESISTTVTTVWTAITEAIGGFMQGIWGTITSIWNSIYETISPLLEAFRYLFETIFEAIKILIGRALDAISSKVTEIWNGIVSFLRPLLEGLRSFFQTVWNGIKDVVSTVLNAVKGVVTTVWTAIKGVITNVLNAIKSVVSTALNAVKTTFSTVWNNVKSTVTTVLNNIKNSVSQIFNNIVSSIRSAMTNVMNAVRQGFNNVVNFIRNLISQAFGWGRDLIMGIVNGIKNCISAVSNAVTSVADAIRSVLHFSVPDEGPLTDYESWMPDFIGGLAKGIEKSRGMIKDAMNDVAGDMVLSPTVEAAGAGSAAGGSGMADVLSAIRESLSGIKGGAAGDTVIPVYIGSERIEEIVVKANKAASYRSGGR